MSVKILHAVAATAVVLSFSVVSGCGSDSNPLEVIADTDEIIEEADAADADGSDESASDTGTDTEDGSAGETATEGDSDAGEGDDTGDNTSTDTADTDSEPVTDSEVSGETDTGSPPLVVVAFEATYRATFVATWSAETHPLNFPDNPQFSPLTGAVHSEQSVFWQMGQNATDGIEQMAETGATSILLTEVQSVVDEGRALSSIQGDGVGESPGSTSVEFTVNRDNPLVTLVSRLAPSPDWFVGVSSLPMIDSNGDFQPLLTVDLNLYDSGTDGGTRYTSADADIPSSPIDLVNSFPLDTDFLNGQPAAGQLILELIQ